MRGSRRGFFGDVSSLALGAIVSQAILFSAAPLLTRMYSPEQFGVAALFASVVSILGVISTARYELSIVLPSEEANARALVILSGCITVALALLTGVVFFFASDSIAVRIGNSDVSQWLSLVSLAVVMVGLNQCAYYWLSRAQAFRLLGLSRVLQSLVTTVSQIVGATVGYLQGGLIVGVIAGHIATLTATIAMAYRHGFRPKRSDLSRIPVQAREYVRFPIYNAPHALLNSCVTDLPVFIILYYFSVNEVAFFSQALRFSYGPVAIVSVAVGQVLFQRLSIVLRDGGDVEATVRRLLGRLLLIGLVPFLAFSLFGPAGFSFVLGEEWREAGVYAQYLSPWILLVFAGSPISFVPLALGQQHKALFVECVSLVTRLAAVFVGGYIGDPRLMVMLYSIVSTAIAMWSIWWILRMARMPASSAAKSGIRNGEQ
jgi:lipopolysaccharide exporter